MFQFTTIAPSILLKQFFFVLKIGSTSVLHDSEDSIEVSHCFDPGCYSRQIKYNATLRQITMLSELSNVCQQSIQVCPDI